MSTDTNILTPTVELVTKYSPLVDELFTQESKASLVTNNDYDFTGAKEVKVYSIGTAPMNDYDRSGDGANWSRYGEVQGIDATTQSLTLTKDRSFTFALDKMDEDETAQTLAAAGALARQLRQVAIPECDVRTYSVMAQGAGNVQEATLTAETVYDAILAASEVLDDALVPETQRCILLPPRVYTMLKKSGVILQTDIAQDMLLKGVIAMIDGCLIVRVPAIRLPQGCNFMMCHPRATVSPIKLESLRIHTDPPGISGSLVEGRLYYDSFVLDNKKDGIYLHRLASSGELPIV